MFQSVDRKSYITYGEMTTALIRDAFSGAILTRERGEAWASADLIVLQIKDVVASVWNATGINCRRNTGMAGRW